MLSTTMHTLFNPFSPFDLPLLLQSQRNNPHHPHLHQLPPQIIMPPLTSPPPADITVIFNCRANSSAAKANDDDGARQTKDGACQMTSSHRDDDSLTLAPEGLPDSRLPEDDANSSLPEDDANITTPRKSNVTASPTHQRNMQHLNMQQHLDDEKRGQGGQGCTNVAAAAAAPDDDDSLGVACSKINYLELAVAPAAPLPPQSRHSWQSGYKVHIYDGSTHAEVVNTSGGGFSRKCILESGKTVVVPVHHFSECPPSCPWNAISLL